MSAEMNEALAAILAPHTEHPYGCCFTGEKELCEDCCQDSAMAVARAVGQREERERLRDLVLPFAKNKMHSGWHKQLAELFEVAS